MTPSEKLKEMGLELSAPKPVGMYMPAVRTGNLIFTSGQIPLIGGNMLYEGKVPDDVAFEQAMEVAGHCALNALAAAAELAGGVDNIVQIVRVNCFVNSSEGFWHQSKIANGASDVLMEIFGDAGRHTRTAIGVSELPRNAPVEVDLVVEVK